DDLLDDYALVLEPSWVGYFLPEILRFQEFSHPIYVQTWETRDREFLEQLDSNLVPVPAAPNGWVDPNVFRPTVGAEKMYDLVYVALWSDFKRHFALFRALAQARTPQLRVACVGQPWPQSLADVRAQAEFYGVSRLVEFFES